MGSGGMDRMLYVRQLDQLEPASLAGTEGAMEPFFSPDGEWVGFFAENKLKKVSVDGGGAMTLCDVERPSGGTWGSNDVIVFAKGRDGLWRVPASGGAPERIANFEDELLGWPHYLPGNKAVLFTALEEGERTSLNVLSLETSEINLVQPTGASARYLPTGHIVFWNDETLFVAPFDLGQLQMTSAPVPALEDVLGGTILKNGAEFSFSESGALVYLPATATAYEGGETALVRVDRQGRSFPLREEPDRYGSPRFSPDGRRVAVTVDEPPDIWVYEVERRAMTRLTFDPGADLYPVWSPDGERIVFTSVRDGFQNLYWKRADGTGDVERLTQKQNYQRSRSWSHDGRFLAFSERSPETSWDLWVLPLEGEREPQPFFRTPFREDRQRFSPDGRWLAYVSNESGRDEVYVNPFPSGDGRRQISTDGGTDPMWGPKGGELFYRSGGRMMVVPYTVEGENFIPGAAQDLFRGRFAYGPGSSPDIAPDGERFVMLRRPEGGQWSDCCLELV
jgi:serine/threonine-protein kinase